MQHATIDRLYQGFSEASAILGNNGEISLLTLLDDVARKSMLLSAASYFERRICDDVLDFAKNSSGTNSLIPSLVGSRVIKRQYHTWFDWNSNNANSFFSMFGAHFVAYMKGAIAGDDAVASQILAFIEIGRERNKLVHNDYAVFTVEKTALEIYELYRNAALFVDRIAMDLAACAHALDGEL
jgi:hypothetical protein